MPTIDTQAGRIRIIDDNGGDLFSTARRHQIITNKIPPGRLSFPVYKAKRNATVKVSKRFTLGSVNAAATDLHGAIKVTHQGKGLFGMLSGNGGSGWFEVGGTYVHLWNGVYDYTGEQSGAVKQAITFTFSIVADKAVCDFFLWFAEYDDGGRQALQTAKFTVDYYLRACAYT